MINNFKKCFVAGLSFLVCSSFGSIAAVDIPQNVYVNNNNCYVGANLPREQVASQENDESIKEFLINVLLDSSTRKIDANHNNIKIKFESNNQEYILILSRGYIFNWSRSNDNDRFLKFILLLEDLELGTSASSKNLRGNNFRKHSNMMSKKSNYKYNRNYLTRSAGLYSRAVGKKK